MAPPNQNFFQDPDLVEGEDGLSSDDDGAFDPEGVLAELEEGGGDDAPAQDDADLTQVDERLEVAMYYRELLRNPLFNEDTPAAARVCAEVREFVKGRLGVLMGVAPEDMARPLIQKVEPQFTDDEAARLKDILGRFGTDDLTALSMLASKVLKKPELVAPPKAPTVRQAAAPAAPAPPPAPPAPAPAPAPRPAPVAAAKAPPARRPPTVRPTRGFGSAAKPSAAKKPTGPKIRREVDDDGNPVAVVGNKRYVRQESKSEPGKFYAKDVTPAVTNPLALPMPNIGQMEQVTGDHASRSVNASAISKNARLAQAAALSIVAPAPAATQEEERP